MVNSRVRRGRETQVLLAEYWRPYWPEAASNPASLRGRDILGVPFSCEVKARREFRPVEWAKQAAKNSVEDAPTVVVMRPDGMGREQIDNWLMFMRLVEGTELLRKAGF
jgi:hypothetical protein